MLVTGGDLSAWAWTGCVCRRIYYLAYNIFQKLQSIANLNLREWMSCPLHALQELHIGDLRGLIGVVGNSGFINLYQRGVTEQRSWHALFWCRSCWYGIRRPYMKYDYWRPWWPGQAWGPWFDAHLTHTRQKHFEQKCFRHISSLLGPVHTWSDCTNNRSNNCCPAIWSTVNAQWSLPGNSIIPGDWSEAWVRFRRARLNPPMLSCLVRSQGLRGCRSTTWNMVCAFFMQLAGCRRKRYVLGGARVRVCSMQGGVRVWFWAAPGCVHGPCCMCVSYTYLYSYEVHTCLE